MKRSPLKRYARLLTRGKPMARSRIRWKPARRIAKEVVFAPYVAWLHADGAVCIACGTPINIQGAHSTRARGTGLKHGKACDMVRLCGIRGKRLGCHQQFDQRVGRFFGWSNEKREEAARGWRLVHWDAFSAWVGVEVARKDVDQAEATRLVECEEAIVRVRLALVGIDVAGRWEVSA